MLTHVATSARVRPISRVREQYVDPVQATGRLQEVVRNMWAKKTSRERRYLWERFAAWTGRHRLPMNADAAVLFVLATSVSQQGQLTYAKALSGTFLHIGIANQSLLSFASALRAAGAAIPAGQAVHISRERLISWATVQRDDLRLCALLAWKSASRWGEVCSLDSEQFVLVTPTEVVVDWHTVPKGRRGDPFTPSKFVVVTGPLTSTIALLFDRLKPFRTLTTVTTEAIVERWRHTPGMEQYTGHSIKRGAVTYLLSLLAQGLPVDPALISVVAKHKVETALSPTTLRYAGDPVALARALGTQHVTKWL